MALTTRQADLARKASGIKRGGFSSGPSRKRTSQRETSSEDDIDMLDVDGGSRPVRKKVSSACPSCRVRHWRCDGMHLDCYDGMILILVYLECHVCFLKCCSVLHYYFPIELIKFLSKTGPSAQLKRQKSHGLASKVGGV